MSIYFKVSSFNTHIEYLFLMPHIKSQQYGENNYYNGSNNGKHLCHYIYSKFLNRKIIGSGQQLYVDIYCTYETCMEAKELAVAVCHRIFAAVYDGILVAV
eukprot:230872_1